jgi:DNA-binding transcriptional ArsR family regulator
MLRRPPNRGRPTLDDMHDVDLAAVGALLGNPSRAAILDALMTGRALTATELARVADVSAPTASEHLSKLREGGLVEVVAQGRHRYHRLASADVGAALESLSHIAPEKPVTTLRQSGRARSLAEARTCYDHLAGRCGVALHDGLLTRGWLEPEAGGYDLSEAGVEGLLGWGVDVTSARAARRRFARPCLDWTERREHLAGSLAGALATALIDGPEPWFVRRTDDHRGLRPTDLGRSRLGDLGWEPVARSA